MSIQQRSISAFVALAMCWQVTTYGQEEQSSPTSLSDIAASAELQTIVDAAKDAALEKFSAKGLKENQLSITLIDLRDKERAALASFRGEERTYPASVVKLFYLAAAQQWLEQKELEPTDELQRALKDMIVDSSNDATGYVLDVLTDTTSGRELPDEEMQRWLDKRNAVNRYFTSLGYKNINANQKTFCEDAYGRERFSRGSKGENRNMLTTSATARLLAEIATGQSVSAERSRGMMKLLERDLSRKSASADNQTHGFTGIALKDIQGAKLWSKAGWTSTSRHDAAYVELPGGAKFVLVTFTTGVARERQIIPAIASVVIEKLR